MKEGSASVRLTEGPIWKRLVAFAIPLFLGNLFQQFYNTADSLIVGNFLGSDALAAVSSSSSLIFLMVGFFNGISLGAGVVIARYFGAKDDELVQRAVHTTIAFGFVAGALLMGIGLVLAPQMLRWMGTPADVMVNSTVYFRVYFCGSIAFVLYNACVGILQSVGDSRHPLYYLIVSSVLNIVLDLVFVGVFGFGVGSAALATIISQFVSAVLCLFRLCRVNEIYRVSLRRIRFDLPMMRQIIANGLPAGVQNSIISFANVVVQSNINQFGKMAVAGCGAYAKIEGFGFLPITCFALSMTTFISQNLGAKEYERAKKGAVFGVICSMALAEVVGIVINRTAPWLIAAFQPDARGHRVWHLAGAYGDAVLLSAGIFALRCGHHARRRTGDGADVCDDVLLVHHPGALYHRHRSFYSANPGGILGVPDYLDAQLGRLFVLLAAHRLGAYLRYLARTRMTVCDCFEYFV